MKGAQRLGLLMLAGLMLAGAVACDRGADRARGPGRGGRWPGPEPQDLGGLVFRIADNTMYRFFPSEAELGTPLGDVKLAVMESIMEDFNVTFEIIFVAENDVLDRLSPAIWAGDMFAHFIITTKWAYGWLIGADLMGDLSAIPTLNLDSDLWMQHVHQATTVKGEVLATAGIFEHWDRAPALVFQKSLWNDLSLPDPYEMVRRGEWTWDRLQEYASIAQQDLTGDGVVDNVNDRWGLVVIPDDFLRAAVISMGGHFFDFHPVTGRLYSPMAAPDGIAMANRLRSLSEMPGVWFREPGQSVNTRNEMFINRRALFYPQDLNVFEEIRAMSDDFGILPLPKLNIQQPDYLNSASHNALFIGITKTNDQLEATGIIMEALAARFAPVRELQRAVLENIILRSDEDVEMLDYILSSMVCDIGFIMPRAGEEFHVPIGVLFQYAYTHNVSDFASEMEARRIAMEIMVNEVYIGE